MGANLSKRWCRGHLHGFFFFFLFVYSFVCLFLFGPNIDWYLCSSLAELCSRQLQTWKNTNRKKMLGASRERNRSFSQRGAEGSAGFGSQRRARQVRAREVPPYVSRM